MKRKTKIIIMVPAAVVLLGITGFALWSFLGGQGVVWTTEAGEKRGIQIPKIPGMELISEEKTECSYDVNYVYKFYKNVDLSDQISGPVKSAFLKKGWTLKDEKTENNFQFLDFYTEKAGDLEVMTIGIGFEQGRGTVFSLEYQWPPCSAEEQL